MKVNWGSWFQISNIKPRQYVCGYCGNKVGSHTGYFHNGHPNVLIYICTFCGIPTLFFEENQYPGALLGRTIKNLPPDIEQVYKEMREANQHSSFTAVSLLGRKLIMHLAVNVAKAKEGEKFVQYVTHLKKSGYIPPNGDKILGYIKDLGNEKNHELKIGTQDEAAKLLKFIESLLIFMYEFPAEFPDESTGEVE